MREEFIPLRLFTKFSKSISITYLVLLDLREVDDKLKFADKVSEIINDQWMSNPSLS